MIIKWRSVVSIETVGKTAKKSFSSIDLALFAPALLGHSLYKGQKVVFPIWNYWVTKNAEFYVEFKIYTFLSKSWAIQKQNFM
jgi:hypothetical protein